MDSITRNYIFATLAVMIGVASAVILTTEDLYTHFSLLLVLIAFYPLSIFALSMYSEGRYHRWINGFDWASMDDRQRANSVSYMGRFMAVSMVLMSLAMPLLMVNLLYGIAVLIIAIAFVFVPIVKVETAMETPFVPKSAGKKVALFIAVTMLALVPCVLVENSDLGNDAVTVEFGDRLHVEAPLVNEYFDYSKIEQLGYDEDFDKGSRIFGYGTPYICSGTFENAQFHRYTLMSYTQVSPCIYFLYEGQYYAFNQADDAKTLQAFEELKGLVPQP